MRTRTTIFVTAMTTFLLAAGVSPAAAVSEQVAANKAVSGRMIAAPQAAAFVKHLPVRVAVRVPPRTTRLWIRLGRRDIKSRFRAAGGSLRVAHLTRGTGLRYGNNRLVVVAERRGGRPLFDRRSFVLARRDDGLVRLRIRRGPVTSVKVRVAGASSLSSEHFGQPKEFGRRISVIRRSRTFRLWLNGRAVTRAVDRSRLTRFTASLSAAHGLRYGVNRLRLVVTEPELGRYVVLRRRFVVPRSRHLPAAGWDLHARVGGPVRLDGRRSRTAGGGQPSHRWRIVRKPRGSRTVLRRAGTARPVLRPDRPGHYVVGLTVTERSTRATASQATPSSTDRTTVTVAPASPLLPFKGLTVKDGQSGIQVGDTFYPNPSPNGTSLQWLTLDRRTLTPIRNKNSWLDGSGAGDHGVETLTTALEIQGYDQLMIFAFPYAGGPGPPVQRDQNDAFNKAMNFIGVESIPGEILQDRNKLAIVGVPGSGASSGWYTHGGGPVDALEGWLMPDQTNRFQFQPERPVFDTSASSTRTSNSMLLHDQRLDAVLSDDRAVGGFQVVKLNPIDFTVVESKVFTTNGLYGQPLTGRRAMLAFLKAEPRDSHVVVQSIGEVHANEPTATNSEPEYIQLWRDIAQVLGDGYGANPDTFFKVNGSYAFLGGSRIAHDQVADSSSVLVVDPTATPPLRQSGTLSGRLRIRSDGYVIPAATEASDSLDLKLYDMVFQAPTPWPYTNVADKQTAANYADALQYITENLDQFGAAWAPDLRRAYLGDMNRTYSGARSDLLRLAYPGDRVACDGTPGRMPENPGKHEFSRDQFCDVVKELAQEFLWLDRIKELFDTYEHALEEAGSQSQGDLPWIADQIHTAVGPPDSETTVAVTNFVLMLMEAAALFIDPEASLAAIEVFAASYELATTLSTDPATHAPVGDRLRIKVNELSSKAADRLTGAVSSLERLRGVIVSDYGRLEALGSLAGTPGWTIDRSAVVDQLTTAAGSYFTTELVPVAFDVWFLSPTLSWDDDRPDTCRINPQGRSWQGAPANSWMRWPTAFAGQGSRGGDVLALGKQEWGNGGSAYPPASLTDNMFRPLKQGGHGLYLPDFVWTQYKAPYPYVSCYL